MPFSDLIQLTGVPLKVRALWRPWNRPIPASRPLGSTRPHHLPTCSRSGLRSRDPGVLWGQESDSTPTPGLRHLNNVYTIRELTGVCEEKGSCNWADCCLKGWRLCVHVCALVCTRVMCACTCVHVCACWLIACSTQVHSAFPKGEAADISSSSSKSATHVTTKWHFFLNVHEINTSPGSRKSEKGSPPQHHAKRWISTVKWLPTSLLMCTHTFTKIQQSEAMIINYTDIPWT